ncbi:hypothetical protein [Saliphagus sp. LR7]|uniref:hypothetical protein n=1 Tax=Saliphagus sp. LR7 TaxID=2282654 RepID=UPI000DF78D38|nr:hypothetical protein [Saliphagus sp. LR7]
MTGPPDPVRAVERYLRSERADVIAAVGDCADRVASEWDGESATEPAAVAGRLEDCLDDRGLLECLATVLVEAVGAAGYDLSATPVAAPPYVVVTSRGPVLRGTVGPGRLVVLLSAFEIVRSPDGSRQYRRLDGVDPVVSLK